MSTRIVTSAAREGAPAAEAAAPQAEPPSAFALLLQRLGANGRPAAAVYEDLRRRLIVYFRLHLPAEAENLADTVFERMAHKVYEGTEVRDVAHYAFGVARLVCLEAQAREQRRREAAADPTLQPQDLPGTDAADAAVDEAAVMAALQNCLRRLDARSSELILAYYTGDGGEGRRARGRLAQALGLSLNALRNRALRIREALELCVAGKLGRVELARSRPAA